LKKPDNTQYKVFIVSKDNPLTWNPVYTGNEYTNDYGLQINRSQNDYNKINTMNNTNNTKNVNQYDYNSLLQKYDNLKREYNDLRKAGFSAADLDSLRRELKEKEDKINQLMIAGRNTGGYNQTNNWYKTNYVNNNLQTTYNDLVNENYDLKNKLDLYKTHFKTQSGPVFLDNDFNNIRNSITQNNKVGFSQAINQLKLNLDNVTTYNYNPIIQARDQEIEKWKQQERIRAEMEKQQFSQLIHKYDQTLTMGEKENQKLKMRLKELQGYFV
jgi:hypothetical protein